jgi:hypothetical protein
MTKRKVDTYEESLKDFSILFRKRIEADMKFWNEQNHGHATGRQLAYASCLRELKDGLEKNGLSLSDIGLAGYEVPKVDVT